MNLVERLSGVSYNGYLNNSIPVIPVDHYYVHSGRMYYISAVDTGTSKREYAFSVGDDRLHIVIQLEAGLRTPLTIKEGVTQDTQGTAVSVEPYNRSQTATTLTKVYSGGAYSGGSIMKYNQAGFGSNPSKANSGGARLDDEFVFKPNTIYLLEYTPDSSTDTILVADFYEG